MLLTRLAAMTAAAVACAGCDQSAKYAARSYFQAHPPLSFVNDMLRLSLARNRGGFLSFGAALPAQLRDLLFIGVVPLVLFGFGVYIASQPGLGWRKILAAALVIGGGASNLLDRLLYDGYVTDFLNVGLGSVRSGIFNIADVAVLGGALYLILGAVNRERRA